MTLTATVTMKIPKTPETIVANLVLSDSDRTPTTVIDLDFTVNYRSTHDNLKDDVYGTLLRQMQHEIDNYKSGSAISSDTEFGKLKAAIETDLILT